MVHIVLRHLVFITCLKSIQNTAAYKSHSKRNETSLSVTLSLLSFPQIIC